MYKQHYMGDLRSILLATDNTEYSEGAIKEAIFISMNCGAKLTVIQVLQVNPEFATEGLKVVEEMEIMCRDHFDHIRELAAMNNVEVESVCRRTEKPHEVIIAEAINRKADLIVLGRRGWKGLKRVLLGSVTAKVTTLAPCKVLIVPKDVDVKSEVIILATDGLKHSEGAEKEAFSMAKRCTHIKRFFVLSVAPSKAKVAEAMKIIEKVKRRAKDVVINLEPIVEVGEPAKVILKKAKETNCDLLILGTSGRTGVTRIIKGSISEKVIKSSPCAVLVVKS
ncbi:MAG: universal stress protein [Thermodesulfovibrionales bacterium]|nr:universal stress protein [Thermodesulfovibrionales bacterium]